LLFDLVVSNPPYILDKDMETLSRTVVQYESVTALGGGGADGMNVIRAILQKLPAICRVGAICWMEVDPTHPARLKEWLSDANCTEEEEEEEKNVLEKEQDGAAAVRVCFVASD
jgi:methylase of polypeptide subunit release factors